MAGTLTVQNLQGPSSGANANKIIVPSGHTIDASAGTLVPSAGQVVQYEWYPNTVVWNSSSSSFSDVQSVAFTPKASGSTIMARFSSMLYKYHGAAHITTYGRMQIDSLPVWQHSYITYSAAGAHMYTFVATGSKVSTGTSPITVDFAINPNTFNTYIYPNTGGMEVWEIAQ